MWVNAHETLELLNSLQCSAPAELPYSPRWKITVYLLKDYAEASNKVSA